MKSPFFGEFMGTAMMILLGNGVVAGVLLKRSKAELGMDRCHRRLVFRGDGRHLHGDRLRQQRRALESSHHLGFAIVSGDFSKLIPYVPAQMLEAFVGATLVWLQFLPHWKATPDQDLKRACFCTSPAIRTTGANLLSEIIATFVLVFVVSAIFSKAVGSATGLTPGLGAYLVASLVWGIGLSLGGTTGYAINPARDLGPRVAHALLPIRLLARVAPIGATRPFRSSARSSALRSPVSCSVSSGSNVSHIVIDNNLRVFKSWKKGYVVMVGKNGATGFDPRPDIEDGVLLVHVIADPHFLNFFFHLIRSLPLLGIPDYDYEEALAIVKPARQVSTSRLPLRKCSNSQAAWAQVFVGGPCAAI